ncbi:hypothetical protein K458DRAFT_482398 [Lentithecium fluviatile CBS 122367]|uniref:Heterokaryon incompatibility domain-containing protein n=1 Tax=Lentithecium fluviatile CBS 122367 TaxID=1168545 RepID=A0A6G1JN43_9PLEO|nr:hypothetical protein K458DRAFT_482398 [Lentithecium fluviatile CBS 122367]
MSLTDSLLSCPDHERSAQVVMMKDIYNKAASVEIWLGESEAISKAHPVISHVAERFTNDTKLHPSTIIKPEGLTFGPEHLDLLKLYTTANVAEKTPMEAYEDLAEFFSLPWFRRMWVLQEAFSHTTITARMGTLSIPWGSIVLAALWQSFLARTYTANPHRPIRDSPRKGAGYLPELWLGLIHNRIPRGLSMVELVCRARDFQASDPRDKVFGLLGLANDIHLHEDLQNLRPDYTKSKSEVHSGFARDIIRKTGTLEILSAINTFMADTRPTEYISWMPNLDISIATIRGLGFPPKYNAAFSTKISAATTNFSNPAILSLPGLILDTISPTISTLLTLRKDLHLYIGNSPNAVATLWTHYLNAHANPTTEYKLETFIHTLTATGFDLPTQFPAHPLGKVVPPRDVPSLIADFAAHMSHCLSLFPGASHLQTLAGHGDADQFTVLVGKACPERKFFVTLEGRMGLCPRDAREGGKVVLLYGGSVLYVLREGENGHWSFVGECYIDGWVFGEAEELRGVGERIERVFNIL